jgi:hypothetical protein
MSLNSVHSPKMTMAKSYGSNMSLQGMMQPVVMEEATDVESNGSSSPSSSSGPKKPSVTHECTPLIQNKFKGQQSPQLPPPPPPEVPTLNTTLLITIIVIVLGSSLQFGYGTGRFALVYAFVGYCVPAVFLTFAASLNFYFSFKQVS